MIKVVEWDEYGNIFCERQMPEDQLSNTAKCFQSDRWMITEEDTQDKWVENDCLKNKIKQSTSLSENVLINLPCNANIYIDEVFYGTNTDNPSENVFLNFPYKRDWKIRITSRGYFDWEAIYGN